MTGRDLITASLKLLGALAPGESLEASEASDGLAAANRMLDSWSNESLVIFDKVREEFVLTAGKQSYTMGTGGDFNTSRPMAIEEALLRVTTVTPIIELPMDVLTVEEWELIRIKALQSTYPLYLYAEPSYPLATINIYPNPTAANSVVLYSRKPLSQIATLDTALSLPQGYEEALTYNLAIRLAPEYGRAVPDVVGGIAAESKAAIKRTNHRSRFLRVDRSLESKPDFFNWLTGDTQ